MNILKHSTLFLVILITSFFTLQTFETETRVKSDAITAEELSYHVHYLASPELEGRRAGTPEARKAARYIAREFIEYGLLPPPSSNDNISLSSYFQPFEFPADVEEGPNNLITITISGEDISLQHGKDFKPYPISSTASVSGEVMFLGFGIAAPAEKYDDFEDTDVTDKIVLVFNGTPEPGDPHSPFARYAPARPKAIAARVSGAKALLIVTEPTPGNENQLVRFRRERSYTSAGIPVVNITPRTADKILQNSDYSSSKLYNKIIETKTPNSFYINDVNVSIETDINILMATCNNVIGYLPGNDPSLKDEYIIVGAHYDHIGWGGEGSMVPDVHDIHPGADDNASGTAGMLELAQAFASVSDELKRSIIFMGFAAEELGLIGSQHYVNNPIFPLENTNAMINLDMIGYLRDDELIVFGVGTSPIWDELITQSPLYEEFNIRTNPEGLGPSDHASFYGRDIPVLFFHTGLHLNYHRPSDTADKINYEGMEKIVNYVYDVVYNLNTLDERPLFTKAESPRPRGTMRGINVYVGAMPDYVGESGGLKVMGVREGSPADKAGIKTGDIIIKFGEMNIDNVYDYTYALGEFNAGDVVSVVILRNDEEITLSLELAARQ